MKKAVLLAVVGCLVNGSLVIAAPDMEADDQMQAAEEQIEMLAGDEQALLAEAKESLENGDFDQAKAAAEKVLNEINAENNEAKSIIEAADMALNDVPAMEDVEAQETMESVTGMLKKSEE
jgi:hypothetical protein